MPFNRFGFDRGNPDMDDRRLTERDYSISGGVSMYHRDIDWGFGKVSNHFGQGPKNWKRSDERIKDDVCQTLYKNPDVDASDIEVEVKDGSVLLSGTVEDRASKWETERCLEGIIGISDIRNELKVLSL